MKKKTVSLHPSSLLSMRRGGSGLHIEGRLQAKHSGFKGFRGSDRIAAASQHFTRAAAAESIKRLVALGIHMQLGPRQRYAGEQTATSGVGKNLRLEKSPFRGQLRFSADWPCRD